MPHRSRPVLLLGPSLLLIGIFFAALTGVLASSVLAPDGTLTFKAYKAVFGDEYYLRALLRSLWIACYATAISFVLGYPIAYMMSRGSRRFATFATLFLAIQFFSIYVIKMYGWMLVLGNNGIINRALLGAGLTGAPIKLMYNEFGVAVGLVASALPLMVFPINAVLQNVSRRYEEAALGLGASRWRGAARGDVAVERARHTRRRRPHVRLLLHCLSDAGAPRRRLLQDDRQHHL